MLKTVTIRAILLVLASALSIAAYARADAPRHVDIPAGDLSQALLRLSKQYGADLVYRPEQVYGLKTHGAHGEFTTEQAVVRLLQDTPLELRTDSSGAMLIAPPIVGTAQAADSPKTSNVTSDDSKEGKKHSSGEFRVAAQVDQRKSASNSSVGNQTATSQDQSIGASTGLSEIIVTAQKRTELLHDVPMSIVAISAEELERREVVNLDDLSFAVPGLTIASSGSYQRRIMLRGVSNVAGNSSLVGIYLDEAAVTVDPSQQLDLRTYDLDRVEVLRGPQGTLYGEGSVGGTVRFITKNPVLDRFAMNADVAALFTQDGAPGQRIEAMMNVPLIDDVLAVRVAGTFDHEGGWLNQPAANQVNFNDENLSDVRVKALWQPQSQLAISATALIHRNSAPPNEGEDGRGNYTQTFNLTTTPRAKDNYDLYNLTLSYNLPVMQVLDAASYIVQNKAIGNLGYQFEALPPPMPAFDVYEPLQASSSNVFTDELRLTSLESAPWQWTVGAFFRHARFRTDVPQVYFGFSGPVDTPLPTPVSVEEGTLSRSSAAFVDVSYEIASRFTVGAGIRDFHDDQEELIQGESASFHSVDPRFIAEYKLSAAANVYITASKGFRSGGFNALNLPTYGPESVWTYEFGAKTVEFNNHLSIDAAVFDSEYRQYQIVGVELNDILAGNITSNAGNARIKGAEVEANWRPNEQWSFSLNADYLDTRFTKINASSTAYDVGDPLDLVPKYGFTASAERDFTWKGRKGFARLDYEQQGRETFRNRHIDGPGLDTPWYFDQSDVIHMLNFHFDSECTDTLSLGFFAQNILNDRGFTDPFNIETAAGRSRPRTYGLEFKVNY